LESSIGKCRSEALEYSVVSKSTVSLMQTTSPEKIVHEIAEAADNDEELVSKMYADALEDYRRDARIMDYVSLFAARRVRENLKIAGRRKG
jgi:hypothetical protein